MPRTSLLAVLLLALAVPVLAGRIEQPHEDLVVEYPEGGEDLARRVGEMYPDLVEETEAFLRRSYGGPVRIVLCRNRAELAAAAGSDVPEWALAVAVPSRGVIGVRLPGLDVLGNDLRSTLLHELAHLALGRVEATRGRALPLWFHEGVAEWASRSWHPGSGVDLSMEAALEHLIPLSEVEDEYPESRERAALAYVQARSFIDFLEARSGRASIPAILDRFEAGADFEAAFLEATGLSVAEAEARWREAVTPEFPWLYVISRTLSLFSVLAILVVIAYACRARRARRMLDRWEEEEAGRTEPDPTEMEIPPE